MTILYAIARYIGVAGCALVAVLFYYEGVPSAYRITVLQYVPIIGDLAIGKKHSYAFEQVRIATVAQKAQCEATLEKMVSTVQYETLAAQLAEQRRQASQALQISEEYRKRADAAMRGEAEAKERLENAIAEDVRNDDGDRWTDADLEWLRNHRQGPADPR